MPFTEEAIHEFKAIFEDEFGELCTMDQAREMAGRVMMFYEGLARWTEKQEERVTPPNDSSDQTARKAS